jgi:hypothetical protein
LFLDLYNKLIARFSNNISIKKSLTELVSITQLKGESVRAYLKRFNEKMLKVENLLELMAIKALISGINNYSL